MLMVILKAVFMKYRSCPTMNGVGTLIEEDQLPNIKICICSLASVSIGVLSWHSSGDQLYDYIFIPGGDTVTEGRFISHAFRGVRSPCCVEEPI